MAQVPKLTAKKRTITGRKVKQLRRQQILPANIYGKGVKSLAIELPLKEFTAVFKTAGETNIINLTVDKETKPRPVLVSNVQFNPLTDSFLHVDFRQVDLAEKVTVAVPVELTGEAPAVAKGGVLIRLIDELEISALPKDLPDKLAVDISGLEEIGQGVTIKQIPLDSAKIKLITENQDELVVKIEAPSREEEAPAPAEAGAEAATEVTADKQPEDKAGTEPAADQDKPPAANKPQPGGPDTADSKAKTA